MKAGITWFVTSFLILAVGCRDMKDDFAKAKSLKIAYTVKREKRFLTLKDEKQIDEIVSLLDVEDTDKGTFLLSIPRGRVEITLQNDNVVRLDFVKSQHVERSQFGQLYLKNDKFYKKINEILSKKEGRNIDVLGDN